MATLIKVAAILWTLVWGGLFVLTLKVTTDPELSKGRTAEQVQREHPTLTAQQVQDHLEAERIGRDAGAACCLTLGTPVMFGVWATGMVGLGVMFLLFRKREPVQVIVQDTRDR